MMMMWFVRRPCLRPLANRQMEEAAVRVGVVGNSHIAARKAAIKSGRTNLSGLEVVFWGLNRGRFSGTILQDGRLVSRFPEITLLISEGAYETFPVSEFDAIIFEGTRLPISNWVSDLAANGGNVNSYSRAFYRSAALDILELCPVFKVARDTALLRGGSGVYLSPAPARAEGRTPTMKSFDPSTYVYLESIAGKLLAESGIQFLPQPSRTLTLSGYTKQKFSDGAVRLVDQEQILGNEELFHMNSHYGAVLWDAFLEKIGAPQEALCDGNADRR
jgi:hypothetical protein